MPVSFEAVRSRLRSFLESERLWDKAVEFYGGPRTEEEIFLETHRLAEEAELLPSLVESSPKSRQASERERLAGNEEFMKRDDLKAIARYTMAVGHAPVGSKESALAYANRSAVTHSMGEHDHCVRDVDAALSEPYPDSLRYKILERKGKSLLELGQPSNASEALKAALEYLSKSGLPKDKTNKIKEEIEMALHKCKDVPPEKPENHKIESVLPELKLGTNQTIDCASSAINISYTEKMGRHIVATTDIMPGDVLAIEKPYASVLLPNSYNSHCFECKKRCHSLIPCSGCTKVFFCSSECSKKCWEESHRIECQLVPALVALGSNSMELLSMRVLLMATEQGAGLARISKSLPQLETSDSPLTKGFKNGKYRSDEYVSMHNLIGNKDLREPSDLFARAVSAVCMIDALDGCTDFFRRNEEKTSSIIERAEREWKLKGVSGGLVLRYLQSMACNAHEISEMCITRKKNKRETADTDKEKGEDDVKIESNEIGGAVYPFLSLINHSCDPNVVRHSHNGDCVVLTAIQVIKAGQQIFDNYGYHYAIHTLKERREHLKSQYFFSCECLACVEDWSLYSDLLKGVPSYLPGADVQTIEKKSELFEQILKDILAGDTEDKLLFLFDFLILLQNNVKRPWKEYSICQEAIKQCLALKANHYFINT